MQAQGKSLRRIARELRVARNTVRRYVHCDSAPPQGKGAVRRSAVLAFAGYLEQRWRDGKHNGFRLWQGLRAQGFAGGVDAVQRFVRAWRETPVGQPCPIPRHGLAPRRAARLLLDPEAADDWERQYLAGLCASSSQVGTMQQLGRDFQ